MKRGAGLLLWLLSFLLLTSVAFAGQVSQSKAWQVAQNFMRAHVANHGHWNSSQSPFVSSVETVYYQNTPVAYLVTVNPTGHMLIAYYDDISPVLFYSPAAKIDPAKVNDPRAIESWI